MLFIHIPKTAGVAIRCYSTTQKFFEAITNKVLPKNYDCNHNIFHARWRDLIPEAKKRKCVAVIRNPWSRVVSRYMYRDKINLTALKKGREKEFEDISFEEFLKTRSQFINQPYNWHQAVNGWTQQIDYVCDEKGDLKSDIVRLENLEEELSNYVGMKLNIPVRNTNINTDYRTFYTPATIQIIADWYKEDIDYFGFDFDTPATRNIYEQ